MIHGAESWTQTCLVGDQHFHVLAYDTILNDLADLGICGKVLNCLKDFLSNCSFNACLDSTLSNDFFQENGVLQGSVLSTTLLVKMNSIAKTIPKTVMHCAYVDDVRIFVHVIQLTNM